MRERLYALRDTQNVDLSATNDHVRLLLTIQEQVFEIKEELEEILWAIETARDPNETRFTNTSQSIPFQINWTGEQYLNVAEMYAHQDIRDYLEEMYVIAPKLIKESNSHWLNLLMNITLLGFFGRGLEFNQQDELKLKLHSRVHGSGEKELDYLLAAYHKALAHVGVEVTHISTTAPGFRYLQIKGPRLKILLRSEEGIHLFHPPNENALPIQVSLTPLNGETHTYSETLKIIRSYALPTENSSKAGVLTDLRTGMLNRTSIAPHEWALLWYANLPAEERTFL